MARMSYSNAQALLRKALRDYAEATDTANVEGFTDEAIDAVDVVLDGFGTNSDAAEECEAGIHSWAAEVGKLPADTKCDRCGETYGDPA